MMPRAGDSGLAVAAAALAAVVVLGGCSGSGEEAAKAAADSCTYPAPQVPNFDPASADVDLLAELATVARERSMLADAAAAGDQRWQPLADAARALTAYADTIWETRRTGGDLSQVLTPAVWDQVKYASDAFILECRAAIDG